MQPDGIQTTITQTGGISSSNHMAQIHDCRSHTTDPTVQCAARQARHLVGCFGKQLATESKSLQLGQDNKIMNAGSQSTVSCSPGKTSQHLLLLALPPSGNPCPIICIICPAPPSDHSGSTWVVFASMSCSLIFPKTVAMEVSAG